MSSIQRGTRGRNIHEEGSERRVKIRWSSNIFYIRRRTKKRERERAKERERENERERERKTQENQEECERGAEDQSLSAFPRALPRVSFDTMKLRES